MKISIITAVYNNKEFLEEAIKSVLSQTYSKIEYIIVDGGSTDGSVDIIRKYESKIFMWISEPDKGIYDALNKGTKLATGDVIGHLHSDDIYAGDTIIQKTADLFIQKQCDSVYGDLVYVDKVNLNKVLRYWRAEDFDYSFLKKGWMPPHPTFFLKRSLYEKFGSFEQSLKISADYELILRMLGKNRISTCYLPEVLIKMRMGGKSNKSIANIIRKSYEDYKALKMNMFHFPLYVLFLKNLRKLPQWFVK
jgi:glycosyltransferase